MTHPLRQPKSSLPTSGFSLIEMIVALALFSTVLTISVGALLMLIAANGQLREEQSIMTNLSFALDSMTRELRTGVRYYCESHPITNGPGVIFGTADLDVELGDSTNDCANGRDGTQRYHGVSFQEAGDSLTGSGASRILYYYDANEEALFRRVGNQGREKITSDGIEVIDAEFFVTGSEPEDPDGDTVQPLITIYLEVQDASAPDRTYRLQTHVTQRTLDI
ncbi:MAG: prepilin-type N-terminal cleavage/methylation domain-containing protein [Patescibacteria group bacterium]